MRGRLLVAAAAVALNLAPAVSAAKRVVEPPRDLHGPLSDFWLRVVRSWSRRIPGLNHGITQTSIWVPIVWDGPDGSELPDFIDRFHEREQRRWVRSSITRHRWREIAGRDPSRMQALRQNIIVVGTPQDNALVGRALDATPLRVTREEVTVGDRRIPADGLLVIAIAPNPVHPADYALVVTAATTEALLTADQVAYGDTDYVVFRGRKVIERGFFNWRKGEVDRNRLARSQSFGTHLGWRIADSAHGRIHYDPVKTPPGEPARLGGRLDAELQETAAFFGIGAGEIPKLDLYAYASIDEKVFQTSDMRPAHLDPVDAALHVVHGPAASAVSAQILARALIARSPDRWGPAGARDLPGLAFAVSLACRESFQEIPLSEWARASRRDPGWLPMDRLFYRAPAELESGDLDPLDAAAFVRDLIEREGAAKVAELYRTARRSDLASRFKEIFGRSLGEEERRWLRDLRERASEGADSERADGRAGAETMSPSGTTPDAAALAARARAEFRAGRFAEARATSAEILARPDVTPEDRAWARVTRGRAHAVSGRLVAAIADLRHQDVAEGPAPTRILADYWLEKMGQPLNQRAAHRLRVEQAGADLLNWDWDRAEEKLKEVLASDPTNREAHALLGQTYLSRAQHWYDYISLFNELFGGDSDPGLYAELAKKGQEEIRIASSLPGSEAAPWYAETGEEILLGDERRDPILTRFLQAKARIVRGELDAAASDLRQVLELNPTDRNLAAYCRLYLGRIALRQGDPAAARAHFKEILRLKPHRRILAAARADLRKLDARSPSR